MWRVPWQHTGAKFHRSWSIAETRDILEHCWNQFANGTRTAKAKLFKETRDRKVDVAYPDFLGQKQPTLAEPSSEAFLPPIKRYAFRSFNRHWAIADTRFGDFIKPSL